MLMLIRETPPLWRGESIGSGPASWSLRLPSSQAIDRLRTRPEVDSEPKPVLGMSPGDELALLLGAHVPGCGGRRDARAERVASVAPAKTLRR